MLIPTRSRKPAAAFLALTLAALCSPAFALITGAVGNQPISDPGFPKGALDLFNLSSRIAYWEGPPFGGGQYHGEYSGDTKEFNAVLADFAKLNVKTKKLVIHDGVGNSFWLNTNDDPAKEEEARMDWALVVWSTDSWNRLRDLPPDLNPIPGRKPNDEPPVQIDVYTGGHIKWSDVTVPQGLEVTDERLSAHGFTLADGCVLEGTVTAIADKKPLAAHVILQSIESKEGRYVYTKVTDTKADAKGHWVLKKTPPGWYRLAVEADGYVARVAGYCKPTAQPRWSAYDCRLARPAAVAGQVTDDTGKPISDVEVRLDNVAAKDDAGRYESPNEFKVKTDAKGQFRFDQAPIGSASLWLTKPGYVRPGLGPNITVPDTKVALTMKASGTVVVTVDFNDTDRSPEYMVEIEAEGGPKTGSWGGSSKIDDNNKVTFKDLPPGKYVVTAHPNPYAEKDKTDPITIEVKPGENKSLTITPK
jgi:hypothetical protein